MNDVIKLETFQYRVKHVVSDYMHTCNLRTLETKQLEAVLVLVPYTLHAYIFYLYRTVYTHSMGKYKIRQTYNRRRRNFPVYRSETSPAHYLGKYMLI